MNYHIVITQRAERDMRAIANWWSTERSAEQASRWLAGLDRKLHSLTNSPQRCAVAPEQEHFPFEVREIHFGLGSHPTHRAIFTIAENLVIVLAVRHAAQDWLQPTDVDFPI